MHDAPLVLTLDIGTSSVRAMLCDMGGRSLADTAERIAHTPRTTHDGGAEFDATELMARCTQVIDAVHARAAELRASIAIVALDTFVSNLMSVDEHGRVMTPVYTYADTRSRSTLDQLRARLDEPATYQRVGVPFHTAYWPAQLLWLRAAHPEIFKTASRWHSFGDYFLQQLFGESVCSYSVASWTGLLDRFALRWDQALLDVIQVDERQLSSLVGGNFYFTGLSATYASRWPLLKDARWFPAIGDGAAANIGSGCFYASRAALTIGTTAAMRVVLPGTPREVPYGLWCYRVDERRSLLGGALSEGGNVIAWLRDLLGDTAPDELSLSALSPDAHGLTCLPLIAGERSPGWRADARGALTGLSLTTQPAEILRAGMEAVALRLGLIWQLLATAAPQVKQVVGSGGGLLASPLWMQIIADVLAQPVSASAEPEATSRGAALLALEAMQALSLADAPFEPGTVYRPDAQRHQIYARALERQVELYRRFDKRVASALK